MSRTPLPVRNPRTGRADHHITPLSAAEVDAVARRLRAAQPAWADTPPARRAQRLHLLADALEAHAPAIIAALEADTGRRRVAALELETTVALARRWARQAPALIEAAETRIDTSIPTVSARITLVPYPLVGVISPWNFPLLLALTDALPALAAGCAALVKPSEVAPRFIRPLAAAIADSGLADLLAVIEGDGETGAALIDRVDYLAFTGSVATGRKVAEAAARAFIPVSLELGGKDPMIILESADPVEAATIALSASCRATGQACQSIERLLVARPLLEPFLEALVVQALSVRPNHPDIGSGDLGPFIFARQAEIVAAQLEDARAKGATILTGGEILALDGGLWLLPTIVTNLSPDMALLTEETFGPVLPVQPFDTVDQAVALANEGPYGLSASVIAGTLAEAEAVALRLEAGAVSLNDGALTALVSDAEKSSFGLSGLGPSRMGASGLLRFFRKRALLAQHGRALPLAAFSEAG